MNTTISIRRFVFVVATSVLVSGCSAAPQFQFAPVSQSPTGSANAFDRDSTASSIKPSIRHITKDLIYASVSSANGVFIYTHPGARLVASINGLMQPQGLCTDNAGNVWVANTGASNLLEYAHGGTSPIATLSDVGQYPYGCSVNPKTGDLAVANLTTTGGGTGSVSIYKKAKGTPTVIAAFPQTYFVAYDPSGNIFSEGYLQTPQTFLLGEIVKGTNSNKPLTISGASPFFPGGLQYAEGKLAVGDTRLTNGSNIYQVVVSGSTAQVVGTTNLASPGPQAQVVQFLILGNTSRVFAADVLNKRVLVYNYPGGGMPIKSLNLQGGNDGGPTGVAISKS